MLRPLASFSANQFLTCLLVAITVLSADRANGQQRSMGRPVVPGTGSWISYVGDDFENPEWDFVHRYPKSSREQDGRSRSPMGYSKNGRWFEGPERGQPDHMKVIATPAGGMEGSQYSLLLRTLNSGVPGRASYDVQQDDLIVNTTSRLGTSVRPSESPSCVVRIYLPPPEQWENRSGPHFGYRLGCSSQTVQKRSESTGFFGGSRIESVNDPYWPGMWIHFRSETSSKVEKDSAYLKVRGDNRGRDFFVRELDQFGWWTLGMSVTPDGMVHYYASPGVDDLTAADHLTSQFPYSYRAVSFRTFFFNVCNRNDGKTWSTPFVIDDPRMYIVDAARVTAILDRKLQRSKPKSVAQKTASKPSSPKK